MSLSRSFDAVDELKRLELELDKREELQKKASPTNNAQGVTSEVPRPKEIIRGFEVNAQQSSDAISISPGANSNTSKSLKHSGDDRSTDTLSSITRYKSQLEGWSREADASSASKSPPDSKQQAAASTLADAAVNPGKSKKQLKRERREARLKDRETAGGTRSASGAPPPASPTKSEIMRNEKKAAHANVKVPRPRPQLDIAVDRKKAQLARIVPQTLNTSNQIALFSHLPSFQKNTALSLKVGFAKGDIHPAILSLGLKIANGMLTGSSACAVAMLETFQAVFDDFNPIADIIQHRQPVTTARLLSDHMKPLIQFLIDCRPLSISMGNALKWLKLKVSETKEMDVSEARSFLRSNIKRYVQERIIVSAKAIANYGVSKIDDNDVVLVYSSSHVLEETLFAAHEAGRKFRVIVIDSIKRLAVGLLRRLVQRGIECSYAFINACCFKMKEATKVFLPAHAMMANGTMLGRSGCATIALVAKTFRVPVLVLCESYKFSERVQTDSITFNELGDPDDVILSDLGKGTTKETEILKNWKASRIKVCNLVYDLTPATLIDMVVSEVGMIPSTSVAVVLREYAQNYQ